MILPYGRLICHPIERKSALRKQLKTFYPYIFQLWLLCPHPSRIRHAQHFAVGCLTGGKPGVSSVLVIIRHPLSRSAILPPPRPDGNMVP